MVKKKTQSQAAEAAVALPTSETGKGKGKRDSFVTSGQQAAGKTPAVVQSPGAAGSLGADSKGTKQHAKDEIDKIFAGKRKASAAEGHPCNEASDPKELRELAEQVQEARSKAAGKRPKVEGSKDDIFGESTGKARKRTDEGYQIYSEEELGLGNKGGGDTPLCPFDCDCCY